jgi:glycosyltransferase involved in cell wall biosynthesis
MDNQKLYTKVGKEMVKVSIIVPIYNMEEYLSECLDSIISQTLKDIEIICVNDGSTDNSATLLDSYSKRDKRIKVVHKKNSGYGHTMNIGLALAKGEYIGIVESDDFVSLDMFEKLYNTATSNDADVVKSNYFEYSGPDKSYVFKEVLYNCNYNIMLSPMDNWNLFFTAPCIWSGIYRTDFIKKNNIVFNETPGASYQDTSFIFKVWSSTDKVFLLQDGFVRYRIDNNDSSVKNPTKIFCISDEFEAIKEFIETLPEKKIDLEALSIAVKFDKYIWNYNRLASAYQYAFLLKMVEEFKLAKETGHLQINYWDPNKFQELNNLLADPNHYFSITAKDFKDSRLTQYTNSNLSLYRGGFINYMCQYENVIIYGAGIIGLAIANQLVREEKHDNILCFAVSDVSDNPESLMGLQVNSIYDLAEYSSNSLVLIATKERTQYEIIKILNKLHFLNIVSIDSFLYKLICNIDGTKM